jgi:putative IMPACT (imprinted ancient) family translation regulator
MPITLISPAQHAMTVRGSRFLADAAPVRDVAAAMHWLIGQHHDDATHNCWAWRCGVEYRSSDDGEPGGSAGRPILHAIDAQGFDEVVVRVARWFGGTKLGMGGLVRAYGGCAAQCLRAAPRREIVAMVVARIEADPATLARLRGRLDAFAARIAREVDRDGALHVSLPQQQWPILRDWLAELTRGRARCDIDIGHATT